MTNRKIILTRPKTPKVDLEEVRIALGAKENLTGVVESYDATRGVARVKVASLGRMINMHTGAFISGRPNRHPSPGETIYATVQRTDKQYIIICGRPKKD